MVTTADTPGTAELRQLVRGWAELEPERIKIQNGEGPGLTASIHIKGVQCGIWLGLAGLNVPNGTIWTGLLVALEERGLEWDSSRRSGHSTACIVDKGQVLFSHLGSDPVEALLAVYLKYLES